MNVNELYGSSSTSQLKAYDRRCEVMSFYLVWYSLKLIDVRVARKVQLEVVVQRLPHSRTGAIWHVTIIPVVDVLHSVTLMWGVVVPGPVKVGLDKFGQTDPADWRAGLPRGLDYAAFDTVRSVGWPA